MKTFKLALLLTFILLPLSRAQEARFFRVAGPVPTTITAFSADGYITWTWTNAIAPTNTFNAPTNTFTVQVAPTLTSPSNWLDYVQVPVTNLPTTRRLFDPNPPPNMVLIPAGSFMRANCMNPNEVYSDELPTRRIYVSACYMDKYEVTNDQMVQVLQWAYQQGKISVTSATVRNLEGNPQELLDMDDNYCRITWDGTQFGMKATNVCCAVAAGTATPSSLGAPSAWPATRTAGGPTSSASGA